MSYRSKRTRAQMTEADVPVPPVTTSASLTTQPGSRIQSSSHTVEEHAAKYVQPDRTFTTNPLLSKTHDTVNSHDLAARKAREISTIQHDAFQKKGEQAQAGVVKPPGTLWKSSTTKPDQAVATNPLLSKTHATVNSHDLAARKARLLSAKQLDASKKRGEHVQVGVKQSILLCKNFTKKPDGSFNTNPLLSQTYAPENSYEFVARKAQKNSAKQPDASKKTGEEAQVGGVKLPDSLWKTSTTKPDYSFTISHLHSKTHATPNLYESANGKAPAKQPNASHKLGEQAQVGPSNVLWKNSPTNSSRVLTLKSTSSVKPTFSLSQATCRPLPSQLVGITNIASNPVENSSMEHEEEVLNQQDANQTGLQTFKSKHRGVIHDWPDNVEFDENEEVLSMDGEGNIKKVYGQIQSHDVWCAKVRYCVTFNEFHQPLKKGGHILVRFIGDMARKERFCPIRDTNWHHGAEKLKVDIVKCIRERFVIPEEMAMTKVF